MPKKGGKGSKKKLGAAIASAAAVWLARKGLAFGWRKATGRDVPDPADPKVTVLEALSWAILAGVTVEATKLFTARATARRLPSSAAEADTTGS
jgi:hypothetical protein